MRYVKGRVYTVTDQNGDIRQGVYTGQEQGAGVVFDVFATRDRIEFQPGFVTVFLVAYAPEDEGK